MRFEDLDTFSEDEYLEAFRNPHQEPPDPEFDSKPRPSAYLILCADEWDLLMAARNLPRDGSRGRRQPYCFVNLATGESHYEGKVRPRPHDRVEDYMVLPPERLGNPLLVVRPDGDAHPEDVFGSVDSAKILNWSAEWSGLRARDLSRLLGRQF